MLCNDSWRNRHLGIERLGRSPMKLNPLAYRPIVGHRGTQSTFVRLHYLKLAI